MDADGALKHLAALLLRIPALTSTEGDLVTAFETISATFRAGGKLLVCGNGGSAADAEHIVGELMKGFLRTRPLRKPLADAFRSRFPDGDGAYLASALQEGLPAIALHVHSALCTAVLNDLGGELVYAQQVLALGDPRDTLLAISTSGNARNVILAARVALVKGMNAVALTGAEGGILGTFCPIVVRAPAVDTPLVQEMHVALYHTMCAMLEATFFSA